LLVRHRRAAEIDMAAIGEAQGQAHSVHALIAIDK
jgi:hypothetical protein